MKISLPAEYCNTRREERVPGSVEGHLLFMQNDSALKLAPVVKGSGVKSVKKDPSLPENPSNLLPVQVDNTKKDGPVS